MTADARPVPCTPSGALSLFDQMPSSSAFAQRRGDFATSLDALDYAARGDAGLNFYSVKGELTRALPYRELAEAARSLAARLLGSSLGPGDRVAIVAATQPEFVIAFFACQYAGLVPVPLPLPAAFGGRPAYLAHVRRMMVEARAAALFAPASLIAWMAPVAVDLALRICRSLDDLASLGSDSAASCLPVIGPDAIAYLQFSSGSTRFPLGVVVHHRALMANVCATLQHGLQIRPWDRAISWLPLYHDMGLVGFLISPMAGQTTVDLLATQDFARRPLLWLSLISERRCTIAYSPSFGYDLSVRRARMAQSLTLDLSCWRIAGIGGDMIRPAVLTGFAESFAPYGFNATSFLPSYGMAEATLAISFAPVGRGIETDTVDLDRLEQEGVAVAPSGAGQRARTVVLCGSPLPLHEVEVRGADGGAVGDRTVGRIVARAAEPDARLRRTAGGDQRCPLRRGLAGYRRPRLLAGPRAGDHRARQGPDHHQRPQHLAAGSGVDHRAVGAGGSHRQRRRLLRRGGWAGGADPGRRSPRQRRAGRARLAGRGHRQLAARAAWP